MIVLLKLILAHFIGDFLLQPEKWVKDKEDKKLKSPALYGHIFLHGLLVLVLLWDWQYLNLALIVAGLHAVIDILKLYAQKEHTRPRWFIIDQSLHLLSLLGIWYVWFKPEIDVKTLLETDAFWIYTLAILFLTIVSAVFIKVFMYNWSKALSEGKDDSLANAGKHIGMLERLFVFMFVLSGRWEGIGFLLAAKSVFRFGDLKESKNRKLTEYILIGTLLSFGIAILTGVVVVVGLGV